MAIALFPLALAILGALAFALSSNPKVSQLGLYAYAAGVFALAFALASHTIHVG